jgi:hypothetical protein
MSYRPYSLYLDMKTFRRLHWIAKAKGVVADSLAGELLNQSLEQQYPQLLSAETAVKQAEQEFARSFGDKLQNPDDTTL